ncbi:MAG: hypothetical protein K0R69_2569 [Clostridia bacterium]|jgi:chromosome segregation ATPase|nr:hypothetical protein [Clostridia bacterium]
MEEKILVILKDIQGKIGSMENKMDSMDKDIKGIKVQLDEHGKVLKALEHAVGVNSAKQEAMEHDIAHIKGDVTAIRSDLSFVEQATARNWSDIAHLKAIK